MGILREVIEEQHQKELDVLNSRIEKLESAIKKHQAQTGNALCWENDLELWSVLGEKSVYPHETLPKQEEFLHNCKVYYESRLVNIKTKIL